MQVFSQLNHFLCIWKWGKRNKTYSSLKTLLINSEKLDSLTPHFMHMDITTFQIFFVENNYNFTHIYLWCLCKYLPIWNTLWIFFEFSLLIARRQMFRSPSVFSASSIYMVILLTMTHQFLILPDQKWPKCWPFFKPRHFVSFWIFFYRKSFYEQYLKVKTFNPQRRPASLQQLWTFKINM